MKILLLNQTFYPDPAATAQQISDLAVFLVENQCEVTVVTERRTYEKRELIYSKKENFKGIKIIRVFSTGFGKASFFLRFLDGISFEIFLLGRALFLPRQDVVVSFTSPPLIGFVGLVLSFLWRAKSVQWLMDINPDIAFAAGYLKPTSPISRFLTAVLNISLRGSDKIVVLDRWMKEKVLRHRVKPECINIVPPWPAHDFEMNWGKFPRENEFRKEQGLEGKFVVCYSGNHSIVHPLETLLEAARRFRDNDEVFFVFIGGGLRVAEVSEFKERYGLNNIIQLPHQPRTRLKESLTFPDMHVVIMGNDVNGLVHTSKIYGILATGRPYVFVGPKESHVADLLSECPHGFHVEHGEVENLVQYILKAKGFSEKELAVVEKKNLDYVAEHYAARKSMGVAACEVFLIKPRTRKNEVGQL